MWLSVCAWVIVGVGMYFGWRVEMRLVAWVPVSGRLYAASSTVCCASFGAVCSLVASMLVWAAVQMRRSMHLAWRCVVAGDASVRVCVLFSAHLLYSVMACTVADCVCAEDCERHWRVFADARWYGSSVGFGANGCLTLSWESWRAMCSVIARWYNVVG